MSTPPHLGPYRIFERIGVGGVAEVHRAQRHGASGFTKDVAIKTLRPEHEHDAGLQRRLIAEARLGAAMAHRNLVTVFDLGVDAGRYYVVMELVRGADLATRRGDATLPEPIALFVAEEVAAGLAYLHGFADDEGHPLGLVHRDISPSNVLVSTSGEVKLADYGIAKATGLAQQTAPRIVPGKYAYLAPEQLAGEPVDARTDQFALGIMLTELVAGRRPFRGDNPAATMDRIRRGDANLDALPEDLAAVVRRCLAPRPDDRYDAMPQLILELAAARRARAPASSLDLARWRP